MEHQVKKKLQQQLHVEQLVEEIYDIQRTTREKKLQNHKLQLETWEKLQQLKDCDSKLDKILQQAELTLRFEWETKQLGQ